MSATVSSSRRLGLKPEAYIQGYRDQAIYITRRIEQVIAQILAKSKEPPILILQSDHGPGLRLDMESQEKTDLHERMSILNAYFFPGRNYQGLYPEITPVNTFRVVLNTFFGADLELLPDRNYFSTWSAPYQFVDVTGAVRSCSTCVIPAIEPQARSVRTDRFSQRPRQRDEIGLSDRHGDRQSEVSLGKIRKNMTGQVLADQRGELIPVEGLAEAIVAAHLQAILAVIIGRMGAQGQDWTGESALANPAGCFITVNDGHLQIHQDQVEGMPSR